MFEKQCASSLPSWVTDRIKEIAGFDPGSTTFRYADGGQLGDETHIRLTRVRATMKAMHDVLIPDLFWHP